MSFNITLPIILFTFLSVVTQAATVESIIIPSTKMKRELPAVIILPDSYKKQTTHRYPVIYLLHGAGDSEKKWSQSTGIAKLADKYNVIILCPNGGRTSWYFDSPIDPKYQFESYVSKDCVSYIDKHYRTQADRQHRALCGNSMGGHGAFFLAIRHQDTFATAVALSGGVDIRPYPNKWNIKTRLGNIKNHRDNWEKLTVTNLAKSLKNGDLALSIDIGTKDFFLKVNRTLF